jgi:hypothetical protein
MKRQGGGGAKHVGPSTIRVSSSSITTLSEQNVRPTKKGCDEVMPLI